MQPTAQPRVHYRDRRLKDREGINNWLDPGDLLPEGLLELLVGKLSIGHQVISEFWSLQLHPLLLVPPHLVGSPVVLLLPPQLLDVVESLQSHQLLLLPP